MAEKAVRKKAGGDAQRSQPDERRKGDIPGQEPDFFDPVSEPFTKWFDYIRANSVRYYCGILKINILSLLIGWALLILFSLIGIGIAFAIFGALLFASPAGVFENIAGSMGAILAIATLFLIGALLIGWAKTTLELCVYNFTDSEFGKKDFAIWDTFGRMKWRILKYMLLESAIWLIIMIPLAVIAGLFIGALALSGIGSGMLGQLFIFFMVVMAEILAFIYLLIMSIAFGFLAQFWRFGFLIDGKGVVESLRASLKIILRRPLEVISFDLLWLICGLMFSLPLILFSTVGGFFIGLFRSLAIMSFNPILWGMLLVVLVLEALITVALSSFVQTFSVPAMYLFWKRIKDM